MSAEQATKSACPHPEAVGTRWGDPISEERQAELRDLSDRQRGWAAQPETTRGDSVFKGLRLTGADVFWLASYATVGPDADISKLTAMQVALRSSGASKPFVIPVLLQGADLGGAQLQGAFLTGAALQGATLSEAQLQDVHLDWAQLQGAYLSARLDGARLNNAQLHGAHLRGADLHSASLLDAQLHGAEMDGADLQGARLDRAQLQGASLLGVHLQGARLVGARMNVETSLAEAAVDHHTHVADVVWNDVPLTQVSWPPRLGDETEACTSKDKNGKPKDADTRRAEFAAAVRANRVLAVTLRSQGLNEDADRFAYRAQLLQRQVLRRQGNLGRAFGSWLLDLISGYGYRPGRSLFTYVFVVLAFATAYFLVATQVGVSMPPLAALIFSVTSFHGRGFMPGENVLLTNPLTVLAAGEAIIGLLIEITFIATFTQRFFAR